MSGNQSNLAAVMATALKGHADQLMYAKSLLESRMLWRSKTWAVTYSVMDRVAASLNQKSQFGGEGQYTLSKIGDVCRDIFAVIEIPGLLAEDTAEGGDAEGQTPSVFPYPAADDEAAHDYCHTTDEAFFDTYTGGRAAWLTAQGDASYADAAIDEPQTIVGNGDGELPVYAHYANATGLAVLEEVTFSLGGQTFDTLRSHAMYFNEELEGLAGKRFGEMVGKRSERVDLIVDSQNARELYVPLDFWFSQDDGDALPLASLVFSGAHVQMKFRALSQMIVQSSATVIVKNAATGAILTDNDLKVSLDITYIYLSQLERMQMAMGRFTVLLTQHQYAQGTATGSQIQMYLTFNHPVIELMFAIRRKCQEKMNNWFNFSGVDGRDPLETCSLTLNGMPYMTDRKASYLRMAIPFRCHRNLPSGFIYNISYSPNAGARGVQATINHSRLENAVLTAKIQDALVGEDVTLLLVARNKNLARVRDGGCGLIFIG